MVVNLGNIFMIYIVLLKLASFVLFNDNALNHTGICGNI